MIRDRAAVVVQAVLQASALRRPSRFVRIWSRCFVTNSLT